MSKPTVHYRIDEHSYVVVGQSAVVRPVDHPSPLVSNKTYVKTSPVVMVDYDSGVFETKNTRYVPVAEEVES